MSQYVDDARAAEAVTPNSGDGVPAVGEQLRDRRERQGIGLRELARRISVSPSLISQIERGKAQPSVATLYAIASELGVSLDSLFSQDGAADRLEPNSSAAKEADAAASQAGATAEQDPNRPVRPSSREVIKLASGVTWERLTSGPDPAADFLHVIYEPGGASAEGELLVRHAGREYGYVLSGRLGVAIGFERFELEAGDSIAFDSTQPHRLWTIGNEPVHAIWWVVGRGSLGLTPGHSL